MRRLPLLAALAACAPDDDPAPAARDADAPTETVILTRALTFARADDGVSEGFDLDGTDEDTCGVPDHTAPDGRTGIDNSFAALLGVIELTGGQAVPALLQSTIDSGELLLLFRAEGWEGAAPGDCVPLEILRGAGAPALGGDGRVLPGQTFDRHPDLPGTLIDCAEVQDDGSLLAAGFNLRLPLVIFDEFLDLTLLDGRLRLTPTDDGWTAVLAGGADVDEVVENVLGLDAVQSSLIDAVLTALDRRADLPSGDEDCARMSITFGVDGVSAWLFADAAAPAAP